MFYVSPCIELIKLLLICKICVYIFIFLIDIFYVQPLTPISITVKYLQPVNLIFRVAENSNGTFNGTERLLVFQYDSDGNSVGTKLAERLEGSTQVFVLDLDQAGPSTSGRYLICMLNNCIFSLL